MGPFPTVLLDPDQLLREGLKRLIEGSEFQTVGEASDPEETTRILQHSEVQLLLLDFCANSAEDFKFLRETRREHKDLRIVILTNRLSAPLLTKALDAGADGYLLKDDLSSESLLQSMRLVMLGEKVFPSRLAAMIKDVHFSDGKAESAADGTGLSRRERDVLRCLVHGYSNKIIGRELGITDATVKVHLKAALRKIKAQNRTQAAIWALNNGLGVDANGLGADAGSESGASSRSAA